MANPLIKKLGLKPGKRAYFSNAPDHFADLLGPLPEDLILETDLLPELDYIHHFSLDADELGMAFPAFKAHLDKKGMIWISWPKKTSKVPSTLDSNIVRATGLRHGLVDVKVCSVDEVWSALKFVYRKEDR